MEAPRNEVRHDDTNESDDEVLQQISSNEITVAIFCALVEESTAVRYTLDEEFTCTASGKQSYIYRYGRIGEHKVIIAEPVEMGTINAAHCAAHVANQFPNVRLALMVGIAAGIPRKHLDIRLGDVAVGVPRDDRPGVIQYDFGKYEEDGFKEKGTLNKPPRVLLSALRSLEGDELCGKFPAHKILRNILKQNDMFRRPDSEDILFSDTFSHVNKGQDCNAWLDSAGGRVVERSKRPSPDRPFIHRGLILSGNGVIENPADRERLTREHQNATCFEMEAAGIMDELPCLVIRGISDYADTHKDDDWRCYAAASAAAYCKAVLLNVPGGEVEEIPQMRAIIDQIGGISRKLKDTQAIVRHTHATTEAMYSSDERDEIYTWLSPSDPSTNFYKARRQHHQGTGQWFLGSDEFAKWKKERNSFLWLNGIPGCGKTVLSSSIISSLEQTVGSSSLLYFFFDFNDVKKQSTTDALRSLLFQLHSHRKGLPDLDLLFSYCQDGCEQPESASLFEALQTSLQQVGELWIVIDALDECHKRNDDVTGDLLPWIQGLRDVSLNIHLLVTSRPEPDIKSSIESWSQVGETITLQSGRIADDINTYIKARVAEMSRWKSRPDIQEMVESVLSQKANGRFRWVSCQIDALKECLDPRSICKELNNLPSTLDATYARILQNIRPEHMDCAKRLLQFLVYSERPLRIEEVVDALAVDLASQPRFDPRNRMPFAEEVVNYCSSLVVLVRHKDHWSQEETIEIHLAHFSVQEYLTSSRVHELMTADLEKINAKAEIVRVCLAYLIDHDSRFRDTEEPPLAEFATQYWAKYAADVESCRGEVLSEVAEYLSSKATFEFGCFSHQVDIDRCRRFILRDNPTTEALAFASFVGLINSVRMLLNKGANADATCGIFGTALGAAAESGNLDTVQTLLDRRADVNAQGGAYGSALQAASAFDHQGIVQLLLSNGADVNAQGGYYGSALQAALTKGHQGIVQLLLSNGVDIDTQGGEYGNALQAASATGHQGIVQLLLSNGADVNAQGGVYGSALQAASAIGHQGIVQLLLSNGADVNAQGGFHGSALQAASAFDHQGIVQLLLDNGADVNTQGGKHGSALQAASGMGRQGIVLLLLSNGADINAQGGFYGSALQAASALGRRGIVQLLLDNGADINAQGGEYGSALQIASARGYRGIVQLLLDNGAVPTPGSS